MYADNKSCEVCGAAVELRPRRVHDADPGEPVGPADGVVGSGDPTVDERWCTNPDCPSHP
jgi:hypothetical protein